MVRKLIWSSAPVAIGLLLSIGLLGQVFRLFEDGLANRSELTQSLVLFVITLVLSSLLAYQSDAGHQENWYRYVLSYSLAITIFCFFMRTGISICFCTALASIAYPLYLLQEIVFRVAFERIWNSNINASLFIIGSLTVLIVSAAAAHVLLEKPMIAIGNEIERRICK